MQEFFMSLGSWKLLVAVLLAACCGIWPAAGQPVSLAAPPRSITDVTAILDRVKPDPARIEELRAKATKEPPAQASSSELGQFYFQRGFSRSEIGQFREAAADARLAIEFLQSTGGHGARAKQFLALQYSLSGDYPEAIKVWLDLTETKDVHPGLKLNGFRNLEQEFIELGNLPEAEIYLKRSEALFELLQKTDAASKEKSSWVSLEREAEISKSRALFYEAQGLFHQAELAYANAERFRRASIEAMRIAGINAFMISQATHAADKILAAISKVKAKQGHLADAEVDARKALLSRLEAQGKYNFRTPFFIESLAGVLLQEGRFAEAERLTTIALEIQRTIGVPDGSQGSVAMFSRLGAIYVLQRKVSDAQSIYSEMDKALAAWTPERRDVYQLTEFRIAALYASGQIEAGITSARSLLEIRQARLGENHFDTALARGMLALGLAKAGRNDDALREFKRAIPILVAPAGESAGEDDLGVVVMRRQQIQDLVEGYISLVASTRQIGGASETFALADSIRGRSVQQALSESSVRASVNDPALAALVRREQDLSKQVSSQLGLLNNLLATPPAERDESAVEITNASIGRLRLDRDAARTEIDKRFPSYADLVNPKPPNVDQVKESLKAGEAMLSFYFGREASFVWAIPKDGEIAFAAIPLTGDGLESKVRQLREALEPQAAMISDIPAFDLKLGYELYSLLLKPVESGWKPAKNLIVVTNGALGLLPLSLLPTAPSEAHLDDDPLFSSYRNVPWLARTHAVTTVPSAAALRTLRQLPPGKANRGELIAFGDPYFSVEQQAEADAAGAKIKAADAGGNTTRGVPLRRRSAPKLEGVDSAELAMLPRLPDTADELKSIALALQADPSKVLNLGKNANEQNVKTLDLSGFKVLAFATHGLVPGELNGLTQPALALSSPAVTGGDGDGLLTMEEILGLKLDADWVVLSACNTGAGAGAGAEAASGLGRAFFYAGTRALLVTNWSVHSQSARELVTDLFKRQADDPKLTRGEALRQAMMALADGPGYIGAGGKTEFAYAHPLFWAPYSIIGDGGAR
jgi:CHAT domain-containing protein/tetratricopeptide (TPR) repeat protein